MFSTTVWGMEDSDAFDVGTPNEFIRPHLDHLPGTKEPGK
jgi:hypothetical protein